MANLFGWLKSWDISVVDFLGWAVDFGYPIITVKADGCLES
jgi:hypothetical protein